jgi:hypothetical protein
MVGKNRYFFPSASPPYSLGAGLEAWRGFYSSVRPSFNQLMVNVNVCATAFYAEGNLAEAMNAFEQASFGARMSAFVQRVRVKTEHLGYHKTIKRLAKFNAKQHKFEAQELGMVTVEEYFRRSRLLFVRSLPPAILTPTSRVQDHFTLSKSSSGRCRREQIHLSSPRSLHYSSRPAFPRQAPRRPDG